MLHSRCPFQSIRKLGYLSTHRQGCAGVTALAGCLHVNRISARRRQKKKSSFYYSKDGALKNIADIMSVANT
jgi:hypothetical protein